jgi:hypothetical protein
MRSRAMVFLLVMGLLIISATAAFAQEGDLLPCTGDNVSGTVVAVDSDTGTVTIDTGEGELCTVTLSDGNYDHPIVALLGQYFDDLDPASLEDALATLQGCAVQDPITMVWSWVDCDTPGAVPVTVTGENPDGSFSATIDGTGDPIMFNVDDPDQAGDLSHSLTELMVTWQLGEDGAVVEAGDRIADYHEDGFGFGVLVKIFAIADESQEACMLLIEVQDGDVCGVTVEELIAYRDQGMGMGQLFKMYGKPSILGVGQVKQLLREGQGKPPWAGPPGSDDGDLSGDDSPLEQNGNSNKNDKNDPPGLSKKPSHPGKGKNKNK